MTTLERRAFLHGFLHGIALLVLGFTWMFWQNDNHIVGSIVQRAALARPGSTPLEQAMHLNELAHQLIADRQQALGPSDSRSFREEWFGAADTELVDGRSACGGYSMVLGRMLEMAGHEFRLGQMRCGPIWGCHVFVEVRIGQSWVALDPTFGVAFRTADGHYLSAQELSTRFDEVEPLLPPAYDRIYRYEDVRYTNWGKIPVLLPALRGVLALIFGEARVAELSLRSYVLNRYRAYFWGTLVLYLGWCCWSTLRARARKRAVLA